MSHQDKRLQVVVHVGHIKCEFVPEEKGQHAVFRIKKCVIYVARIDVKRCFVSSFGSTFSIAQKGLSLISRGALNERWSPSAKAKLIAMEFDSGGFLARPVPGWYMITRERLVPEVHAIKALRHNGDDEALKKILNEKMRVRIPTPYHDHKKNLLDFLRIVKVRPFSANSSLYERGVVAKVNIKKDEEIGMYYGIVDTARNLKSDENNHLDSYSLDVEIGGVKFVVDANALNQPTAMCNDPAESGMKANIKIVEYYYTDMMNVYFAAMLVATRNIKKNSPVLWSYGDDSFWKNYKMQSINRERDVEGFVRDMMRNMGNV